MQFLVGVKAQKRYGHLAMQMGASQYPHIYTDALKTTKNQTDFYERT